MNMRSEVGARLATWQWLARARMSCRSWPLPAWKGTRGWGLYGPREGVLSRAAAVCTCR